MKRSTYIKFLNLLGIALLFCTYSYGQHETGQIDLSGTWQFKIDSLDKGVSEKWYSKNLSDTVLLPGSMVENGKGNDITIATQWTGQIVDSAWYFNKKYAKFRKKGNIKIPYWLQPLKRYVGASWYQKEIEIPVNWKDKSIKLKLERPHWETQIWVDNQYIGKQNSLGTPHIYELTDYMPPGKHIISIRVDNRIKNIDPGINSHSISDHTQSNWNGVVGTIELSAGALVSIENVKLYPDIKKKEVLVKGTFKNASALKQTCNLTLNVALKGKHSGEEIANVKKEVIVEGDTPFNVVFPMGDSPLLWDEFNPDVYTMNLSLKSSLGIDTKQIDFGMRDFKVDGKRFAINGRPIFLRGTLECAIFPKTGYPSTDVEEWKRILSICKAHGLNHMRFHSWCPPEAAFIAADELGVYVQVEASSWANVTSSIGDGLPIDDWLYKEAEDILDAYGNHPSFVMMAYGNEPGGKNQGEYLTQFVSHFKKLDNRRVYTGGAGWPFLENLDYYNNAEARIQRWGDELKSIINSKPPQTEFDYSAVVQKTPMPYVSHEIGQWCVYPDFKEIKKYTGVLKAKNFEIFKETLEENHMRHLSDSLLLASGKLQALCYKADIEAALRTKDFAGFQLLDLHDFPGQGTALVGVLNAFWEEKGYITPEEYKRFCNETVPLARLKKRVFNSNDSLQAAIEVAHFGAKALKNPSCSWALVTGNGEEIAQDNFSVKTIPLGNGYKLGNINVDLSGIDKAQKLILTVNVADFSNSWDLWVYPLKKDKIKKINQLRIVDKLDPPTIDYLKNGGKVLLNIEKGTVKSDKGGDIGIGFSSIFWNTAWTRGQKPHTLGILCNPDHPALAEFPTEYHSNWQWWDAMSHSNAIILDEFTPKLKPIVRVIDDWFKNRRLALVFEATVGKGKLIVSGIDLHNDLKDRPEARQMLYSLKKYMASDQFDPDVELDVKSITGLFKNE